MEYSDTKIEFEDDPFNGYASCPDTRRAYISNFKENQIHWMYKSENVIREFIDKLSSFKNFHDAYVFLASRRHQIAMELQQEREDKREKSYGIFRQEGDHFRQTISAGDGEQFWKWQKNKIFALAYDLISIIKYEDRMECENEWMICTKENVIVDELNAIYYCITTKFPLDEGIDHRIPHSNTLSSIHLYDFKDKAKFNLLRIEYTPINDQYTKGHYKIADEYFKALLSWEVNGDIQVFIAYSAKLAFLSANLLFVKQGNSGIIEWMLRAVAFEKGIEIGFFNYAEGISWDFKAVLTPNRNEYIRWFSEKLFDKWTKFDKSERLSPFSYEKKPMDNAPSPFPLLF